MHEKATFTISFVGGVWNKNYKTKEIEGRAYWSQCKHQARYVLTVHTKNKHMAAQCVVSVKLKFRHLSLLKSANLAYKANWCELASYFRVRSGCIFHLSPRESTHFFCVVCAKQFMPVTHVVWPVWTQTWFKTFVQTDLDRLVAVSTVGFLGESDVSDGVCQIYIYIYKSCKHTAFTY